MLALIKTPSHAKFVCWTAAVRQRRAVPGYPLSLWSPWQRSPPSASTLRVGVGVWSPLDQAHHHHPLATRLVSSPTADCRREMLRRGVRCTGEVQSVRGAEHDRLAARRQQRAWRSAAAGGSCSARAPPPVPNPSPHRVRRGAVPFFLPPALLPPLEPIGIRSRFGRAATSPLAVHPRACRAMAEPRRAGPR